MVVKLFTILSTYSGKHFEKFSSAEKAVHFRHLFLKFLPMKFCEASHYINALDGALGFFIDGSQSFVNGLLFSVGNEAAGVDENSFSIINLLGKDDARSFSLSHQTFRINRVFRAPKAQEKYFMLYHCY